MEFSNRSRIENVNIVKSLMDRDGLDALIIPTDDPHMSEYTAAYFGRRAFLSGFTGSAGSVIITKNESLLFTDGRYHKQAELELDSTWTLMKQGVKDVPTPIEYLTKTLPSKSVVGIDPLVHAANAFDTMSQKLKEKDINVKYIQNHPVDIVWGLNRPLKPSGLIREHPIECAGKSIDVKLKEVREVLQKNEASSIVLTTLDDIAWLFNFRGCDVPCNPISVCYAILTLGKLNSI